MHHDIIPVQRLINEAMDLLKKNSMYQWLTTADKHDIEALCHDAVMVLMAKQASGHVPTNYDGYKHYFFMVVRSEVIRYMERQRTQKAKHFNQALDTDDLLDAFHTSPDAIMDSLDDTGIDKYVKHLKPKEAAIVRMWIDGSTQVEIAEELGVTRQAVSDRFNKILLKIKKRIPNKNY